MLIITAEAEREVDLHAAYYELQQYGLGERFRTEVAKVIGWIEQHPEIPRVRSKGYRRVNIKTFPHYVANISIEESIWILAVPNALRFPDHWIN